MRKVVTLAYVEFFLSLQLAYCALARPWEGLLIGAIGGCLTCLSVPVIEKLKIDDPVGVIPVHFVAAIWGMLSVGLFGEVDALDDSLQYPGRNIIIVTIEIFQMLKPFI